METAALKKSSPRLIGPPQAVLELAALEQDALGKLGPVTRGLAPRDCPWVETGVGQPSSPTRTVFFRTRSPTHGESKKYCRSVFSREIHRKALFFIYKHYENISKKRGKYFFNSV